MQPEFDSRGVTRPLSAFLRLAMLGCPARRARGQLAAVMLFGVVTWPVGLGRLLAVARCARSARSGDSLRYATGDPTMADQPPTRLTIGGAIAGSA